LRYWLAAGWRFEEKRMADKRKAPDAPEGAPRRKRAAPTIDLTATDVTPADITPADVTPAAAEPPVPPQAASEPPASEALPHEAVKEPPPPPPPDEPAHTDAKPAPEQPAPFEHDVHWLGLLAAGAAGGVVVAAIMAALWYGGAGSAEDSDTSASASAQIASLRQQVQTLQNRPAPVPDNRSIDALTQRLGRMEDMLTNLPKSDPSVGERLTAAENAIKALGGALTALNQRSDNAPATVAPAQLDALQQRLTALEQSNKAAHDEITKTADAEVAARLALNAAALRNAVVSGAPYSAELAQAKSLGADETKLAPLAPFAASGVPSASALSQELRAQIPAMLKASGAQTPSGGFLERLQANASKLVRVTPVDAPAGDDPSTVLARIEIESAHADIAGALADLGKLPDAIRAPAQSWIAKVKARQAALDAANALAADSARALGSR
jgi:hypothetical protein